MEITSLKVLPEVLPLQEARAGAGVASMNLQSFIFPFHAVWDAALGFPCTYGGLSIVKILIIISRKISIGGSIL